MSRVPDQIQQSSVLLAVYMTSNPAHYGLPVPPMTGAGGNPAGSPPPVENVQPTVRVMRLYKPGFHMAPTLPYLPGRNAIHRSVTSESAEFTLSSHLLLPDSFGDIYLGEKFAAYISIVNGFANIPFYNVNLSIRLQTASSVLDLSDSRPSPSPSSLSNILGFNESNEVVVQHLLTELGTHTLRVSVQYSLAYNAEIKTLRKFYRFNVLNPLMVLSSFMEINQLPMVQCQVTNSTKSPIFIEEMNFVSRNKEALFSPLHQFSNIDNPDAKMSANDIVLLAPDESFAFAFSYTFFDNLVDKAIGHPVIKWCNSLGDSAVFRGEETLVKSSYIPSLLLPQPIKGLLLSAPGIVLLDDVFEVAIRLYNTSSYSIPVTLSCRNHSHSSHNQSSNVSSPAVLLDDRASLHAPMVSFNPNQEAPKGLIFTGLTSQYLGILESDGTLDIHVNLYAASPGLYDLPVIFILNNTNKERYSLAGLAKIMVKEREDDQEDGAVGSRPLTPLLPHTPPPETVNFVPMPAMTPVFLDVVKPAVMLVAEPPAAIVEVPAQEEPIAAVTIQEEAVVAPEDEAQPASEGVPVEDVAYPPLPQQEESVDQMEEEELIADAVEDIGLDEVTEDVPALDNREETLLQDNPEVSQPEEPEADTANAAEEEIREETLEETQAALDLLLDSV